MVFLLQAEKQQLKLLLKQISQRSGRSMKVVAAEEFDLDDPYELKGATREHLEKALALDRKLNPVDSPADLNLGQLGVIRARMGLDLDQLRRETEAAAGDYLCHVLLEPDGNGQHTVGVTLLTLRPLAIDEAFPSFVAERKDGSSPVRFQGVHYIFEGALHILGFHDGKAYPWTILARPTRVDNRPGFVGTVTTATSGLLSIHAPCFIIKAPETAPGVAELARTFPYEQIIDRYPEVEAEFTPKTKLAVSRREDHG